MLYYITNGMRFKTLAEARAEARHAGTPIYRMEVFNI